MFLRFMNNLNNYLVTFKCKNRWLTVSVVSHKRNTYCAMLSRSWSDCLVCALPLWPVTKRSRQPCEESWLSICASRASYMSDGWGGSSSCMHYSPCPSLAPHHLKESCPVSRPPNWKFCHPVDFPVIYVSPESGGVHRSAIVLYWCRTRLCVSGKRVSMIHASCQSSFQKTFSPFATLIVVFGLNSSLKFLMNLHKLAP